MDTSTVPPTVESIQAELTQFLEARIKQPVTADLDLFASGLVSSLFAMELLVHLEGAFKISVPSEELRLDSFRTVQAMTALVLRLTNGTAGE
jgi:methoxymalonate biosynthesis acyl carrier protein